MRQAKFYLVLLALLSAAGPAFAQDTPSHRVYTIDDKASDVRFLVYRGGLLAMLGHNHVVRAHGISGEIEARPDDFSKSSFHLSIPVEKFEVDNAVDRASEGRAFAKQPSDKAISETTQHMLSDRVLDASRYPVVNVRSVTVSGSPGNARLVVRITLHGVEKDIAVPTRIQVEGARLTADGRFQISQRQFGIKPFTAAAGALRVKDEVTVRFHLVATSPVSE